MKKMRGFKFLAFAVILLAVSGANTAVWGQQSAAGAFHDRGLNFFQNRDYERAIEEYTHAIRLRPDEPVTFLQRGVAYERIGDYTRAVQDYTQAIELIPNTRSRWNYYLYRAEAYFNMGDYGKAISDFTQAISDYTQDINSRRNLSDNTRSMMDDNRRKIHGLRGLAYIRIGDYDSALTDLLVAYKLETDTTENVLRFTLEGLLRGNQ
jgi:tetratricopeptide (TPR) repeat protein